jgi:hypothetical protein
MRSLTLFGAVIVAALATGCDHGSNPLAPISDASSATAYAAETIDPNTLVPIPPAGATCRADGEWIICQTSFFYAPVNEPSGDVLPCGPIYQTGTDERHGIRWYTRDGLLAKRYVRQDVAFAWSLSASGDGPFVTFSVHASWRNVYAVLGSGPDVEPQPTHGNELTISQPGRGVIVHIAGLEGVDDTHRGVFRLFDDPAVATELCDALTP